MDRLIKEEGGRERIWYSDAYLKNQISRAFLAGIARGIKVTFHAAAPIDMMRENADMIDDLMAEFKRRVDEEYCKGLAGAEIRL